MPLTFQDFLDDLRKSLLDSYEVFLSESSGRAELFGDWFKEHFARKEEPVPEQPATWWIEVVQGEIKELQALVDFYQLPERVRDCYEANFWPRISSCVERLTNQGVQLTHLEQFAIDLFYEALNKCIGA